jgi:hypothetical protein
VIFQPTGQFSGFVNFLNIFRDFFNQSENGCYLYHCIIRHKHINWSKIENCVSNRIFYFIFNFNSRDNIRKQQLLKHYIFFNKIFMSSPRAMQLNFFSILKSFIILINRVYANNVHYVACARQRIPLSTYFNAF